eukprot:scaffold825_cov249-Pinguiococcus_pyrenoidosus.AAC.48
MRSYLILDLKGHEAVVNQSFEPQGAGLPVGPLIRRAERRLPIFRRLSLLFRTCYGGGVSREMGLGEQKRGCQHVQPQAASGIASLHCWIGSDVANQAQQAIAALHDQLQDLLT